MALTPAGYSGKPVADKLGIKSGLRLAVVGYCVDYNGVIGDLPKGCVIVGISEAPDVVHLFARTAEELRVSTSDVIRSLKPEAVLWVSWPKRASPMHVDLTDTIVRDAILRSGWVDVKVCAVDQDWSALKFLRRRALR